MSKYKAYPRIDLPNRSWPDKQLKAAPTWCSVDLRDGNQALPIPMSIEEKLAMFKLLVDIGFKEIEVGFPSASETEFQFMKRLVEDNLIPDDVTIQVLTQTREHLIQKTFDSLKGVKKVVVHIYNSTSTAQRQMVFKKNKQEIMDIAVQGTKLTKELAQKIDTKIICEYSPESFTGTEVDFALEVCEAVMDAWQPTPDNKIILNLPATVELCMPNIYADMIEWFINNMTRRDSAIISLHTHNDRGTGVAASELALLAGADRVEGTLFGNGERTGNVDIVTLSLNMLTQGIDPRLNFSDLPKIVKLFEKCTRLPVYIRSPYAGELVYTAFSGSHQDAISKGLHFNKEEGASVWDVPYLAIDPADVGREYEPIIRINSQSGKGGVAYIMEDEFGYKLPKAMHPEFGQIVQKKTDETGKELLPKEIMDIFVKEYLEIQTPLSLLKYELSEQMDVKQEDSNVSVKATVLFNNKEKSIIANGNGPIDAFFNGLKTIGISGYKFISYDEHALGKGSNAKAVAYVQLADTNGNSHFGVGRGTDINVASIQSTINAINALLNIKG